MKRVPVSLVIFAGIAAKNPEKLKEMQALFLSEAPKYPVLPLDNSVLPRLLTPRPTATAGRTEFTYVGENVGIPVGNAPSLLNRDYTITAEITIPKEGTEGMIATMGGRFGGYGLYLQKGYSSTTCSISSGTALKAASAPMTSWASR